MRQGAVRLMANPAPRQLHDDATDMRIPRSRNTLVVVGLAALIRRRYQADQCAEFSTDPNATPADDFCCQYRRADRSDRPHRQQLREDTTRRWAQMLPTRQSQRYQ